MNDDVSRETPSAPEAAGRVFLTTLPVAERFAGMLATEGVLRGLLGPRELPRLWERHLVNCALIAEGIPSGVSLCDIGSGAGLPGLALAIARPDLRITLVEPLLRRTTFLDEAVQELALGNVVVVRGRAEALHGAVDFDVVTSRAVAPLDRLARWSLPLVAPGGVLLAMKGSSAQHEIDSAATVIHSLGGRSATIQRYGAHLVDAPATVVRILVPAVCPGGRPSGAGVSENETSGRA